MAVEKRRDYMCVQFELFFWSFSEGKLLTFYLIHKILKIVMDRMTTSLFFANEHCFKSNDSLSNLNNQNIEIHVFSR